MRAGVIDIGSSSIKLLIGESHGDDVKVIESLKNFIPLGRHAFLKGRIPQGIINQTAAVLQKYKETLKNYDVTDVAVIATTAVTNPCSGLTPEAMAKAMDKGRAMIPTMIPAKRSLAKVLAEYPSLRTVMSFGSKMRSIDPDSIKFYGKHMRYDILLKTGKAILCARVSLTSVHPPSSF